jgi:UDP-glucuronate decarboxylase
MPKKRINILVTGGAGFLGSHLCEALIKQGNEVTCVDNFSSGHIRNIASLIDNPRFTLIEQDIVDPLRIEADHIYNLACPASPIHYQADPLATTHTCVFGASNLLRLANATNATILQASTSEVYGNPLNHPQRESDWGNVNPIGIRSCYDEGKRAAESLFFDHHRINNTAIKVVRIFNTYGPRMHPNDGRVVSNFIVHALQGRAITVYGDGSQTRSFCYYTDLVDGLIRMMRSDSATRGPVNLGNPLEFTVLELAHKVRDMLGNRVRIEFKSLPQDDPLLRKPDISLAKKALDWQPRVSLEEGLERTISYFESILAVPRARPLPAIISTGLGEHL